MSKARVILIDGTAIIFRSFFAIPSTLQTADGTPTNAVYGFAQTFRKVLAGREPSFGAVVFDAPGPTFRDERFTEYKAQRPPMRSEMRVQIPLIRRLVEAHDFPQLSIPGYEADDVIGTLATAARDAGHEVHIISGDKDFAQLVSDDVVMVDPVKDVNYTPELVRKKWGVLPEKFVDFLALTGDSADNIPGVKGIGKKTAQKLLERFGDLEGVLAGTGELKGKQRENLEASVDIARLSQDLATIDCEVPLEVTLEDLRLVPVNTAKVDALYHEFEFFSLLSGDDAKKHVQAADYRAFESLEEAQDFLDGAKARGASVVVLPVFDGSPFSGDCLGLALSIAEPSPTLDRYPKEDGEETEVDSARFLAFRSKRVADDGALALALVFLADGAAAKVGHDVRDLHCFALRSGIRIAGLSGDTRLASFLIDPTRDIPHRLGQISRAWLHRTLPDPKALLKKHGAESLADLPGHAIAEYACHLARTAAMAWPLLNHALIEEGHEETLLSVSLPMAEVLAGMQLQGIGASAEILESLGQEFETRKEAVTARIHELAGESFNVGSPKQLGEVLFDTMGLPVIKRTKTGYSTSADVLERLDHPIADEVMRYRSLAKLINTYTRVLQEAIAEDGRIHCTFQQTAGASGRLITTDPDLQRTPIRGDDGSRIRSAFVASAGTKIVAADWSQIELRILAHVSQDPCLLAAYQKGEDIHAQTAAELFSVPTTEVDKAQRNVGKTVNFATVYGQGATALGRSLKIPRQEAKQYIDQYFELYEGVRDWLDATIREATDCGYVETLLGRRRFIPELKANNFSDRSYGERIATNTPIQGSAADLCKLAMLRIDAFIKGEGLKSRMLLQIHDELVFEAPTDEVEVLTEGVREAMEQVVSLDVPLVADIGIGESWGEAKL